MPSQTIGPQDTHPPHTASTAADKGSAQVSRMVYAPTSLSALLNR